MLEAAHIVIAGLTGMVVGSFLNVVIWRLPREESLVRPRSRCPGCLTPIPSRDNVPVLSWLVLRGRCRSCGTPISVRYPLVELLTGALFVLAWLVWGDHIVTAAVVAVALAALLAISFIDWEHKIIPDRISKPGIVLGIAVAPATVLHPPDWIEGLKPALNAWLHAGAGALAGALVILLIRGLGWLVFRKEAMGLGDMKLLAMIGALTGPIGVLYALVLASFAGAIIGIVRLLWARRRPLRFDLEVKGRGVSESFDRARVEPEAVTVLASTPAEPQSPVTVHMVLPAAGILEDEDAEVDVRGVVEESRAESGRHAWRIRVDEASEEDLERLAMFAASLRYVPFGPFLALGGALTLLFGERVHWLITVGYPEWVRGVMGA